MNFFEGRADNGNLRCAAVGDTALGATDTPKVVDIRPQHLILDPGGDTHRVDLVEHLGDVSYVHLTATSGETMIVETHEPVEEATHSTVGVQLNPAQVYLFDKNTGARLR